MSERHPDIQEELEKRIDTDTVDDLSTFVDDLSPADTARAVSRLSDEEQTRLLTKLPPDAAADLLEELPQAAASEILEHLPADEAAAIVVELPSDEQADLVRDVSPAAAEAIISQLPTEDADQVRRLSEYEDDVAGGLMITELLAFPETLSVADVVSDLRANVEEYRDYDVQYAYVVAPSGKLRGVLGLRDLLLSPPRQPVSDLMRDDLVHVRDDTQLDQLRDLLDGYGYYALPVVDADDKLLGVVRKSDVEEALGDKSESDFRRSQGIVREELRTMPVHVRAGRRLSWLSVNILLNIIAASVIAFYQDTLAKVIALAVFIPIISDMSGCSGNQAVAVSMRELSLGLITPREVVRVWVKEIAVGLINGLALGLLVALVAVVWKGNVFLGLVVGVAMMINTLIAVTLGGSLPLLLKRMKVDPALASGPILTTVTDMCGFFLILSLAANMLSKLT